MGAREPERERERERGVTGATVEPVPERVTEGVKSERERVGMGEGELVEGRETAGGREPAHELEPLVG